MDLKKLIKKAVVEEAANKILPMEGDKPKLGRKAKLAGVLAAVATIAAAGSQLLGG